MYNGIAQQVEFFEEHKCSAHKLKESKELNPALYNYDIKFYKLDIEATNVSTAISGSTTILATVIEKNLSEFVIEISSHIQVQTVLINDISKTFTHENDEISVDLSTLLDVGTDFTAEIFYTRSSSADQFDDGIYNYDVSSWDKRVTYTLSEPYSAKNWFACKQVLEDKADSVYVFVTVDNNLKVGANGILKKEVDLPNNKKRFEWKSYYPTAFYLISIAVADYEEYNIYAKPAALNGDSVLIQNYLYHNHPAIAEYKAGVDVTVGLLELFSDKYSLYPFSDEKYGHCYVPLGGAMEHQTMTSTGSHLFYIIAHELGHQWFGNNVTCATWQDIWINEGFASYSEYLAYEFLYSQQDADDWMENAHLWALQLTSGSVYVPFNMVMYESRVFNYKLTYRKGMALVHMIRNEINNDETFFNLLRGFQLEFADNVASGNDLRDYLGRNTSIDFTDFFDEWYYGEGFPTYSVERQQSNDEIEISLSQTPSSYVTSFFSNTLELKLFASDWDTIIRIKPTANPHIVNLIKDKNIIDIEIDPNNWILNKAGTIIGVDNYQEISTISYYPNPFVDEIRMDNPQEEKLLIEIFTMNGSKVFSKEINTSLNLPLGNLESGMYIMLIKADTYQKLEKIIKK